MNDEDDIFRPEGDTRSSKKKSGGGLKVFLIVLSIVGGLSLLCCCGVGFSLYSMVPQIDDDPAVVQQTLDDLITIDIPETFRPTGAMKMQVFSMIDLKGVIYESTEGDGALIIGRMRGSMAADPGVKRQIEDALNESSGDENLIVDETELREFDIDGQQVEFTFIKGRNTGSAEFEFDMEEFAEEIGQEASDAVENQPTDAEPTPAPEPAAADPAVDAEPTDADPEAADAPAENADGSAAAEAPASAEPTGTPVRQVRGLIPIENGSIMFMLMIDEEHWNEDEVVKMIESIKLK